MSKGTTAVKNLLMVSISIVALLVLSGLIYVVLILTNGFTTDFKSFIVKANSEYITNDTKISMLQGKSSAFEVHYVFDEAVKDTGFSVDVVVNKDFDFVFDHGVEQDNFSDIDISSFFTIEMQEKGFVFSMNTFDIIGVLEKMYIEDTVSVVGGIVVDPHVTPYFTLLVSSYNKKVTYNMDVLQHRSVESIEITPSSGVVVLGD